MVEAGQLVAERFVIERLAGQGGMGSVYRALDRRTDSPIALKILHPTAQAHRLRFLREAQLLASLSHPGIVRSVAQGETASGELYLAMEWLEGTDLGERLRAEGVTATQALGLVRQVAAVLQVAHAQGVVHRDIKPANLFLVDGDPASVKVLDFGIARLGGQAGGPSTQTGTLLGTPGYMSPEQARGMREIDGRADLFSLGCVLFECLVGWAPFSAAHDVAVLAKILLEEPPRLSAHRADLPPELDLLVADLLAKDPTKRLPTAAALLARLAALGEVEADRVIAASSRPAQALTGGERRLFSLVLAGEAGALSTQMPTLLSNEAQAQRTEAHDPAGVSPLELRHAIERLGGQLDPLGGDTYVVSLSGDSVASDQVERAVRCALALRDALPDRAIAVATGKGESLGRFPVGEVIDRAARLLASGESAAADARRPIALDTLTANLLGSGFEWEPAPGGGTLRGVGVRAGARNLLGRATPFVGRERELARLLDAVDSAVEEQAARVLLVTAPPGLGKSRLRDELLNALGERSPELTVWTARGDLVRAGSPHHLVGQLVRRAAKVRAEDSPEVRRAALRQHVASLVPAADADRVAAFLGELAQLPFEDPADVQLRSARRDPQLMADQTRRAFEDWLRAVLASRPLLLVLDDLHWADAPSVRLVDAALRSFPEAPLCVVALARPEVHEQFPRLWFERGAEELRLRELPRRAAEQLVRAMLRPVPSDARVAELVAQAEGNAFFLEEVIRAAADGSARGLPESVLAMAQARLEALDPLCRRVLRAASIFGRVFWRGGLLALCSGCEPTELDGVLGDLGQRELIEPAERTRFAGEPAYQFRHALFQEAASGMLIDSDRALGHRLAAQWLEAKGEPDALVLAEHRAAGGEPAEAAHLYERAADDALRANDLAGAIDRAERAARCGSMGERLGRMRLIQAEAHTWRGEQEPALAAGRAALELLAPGSESWCRAALELATVLSQRGESQPLDALADEVLRVGASPPDPPAFVECASKMGWPLFNSGGVRRAHALLDSAERVARTLTRSDPRLRYALSYAGATRAMVVGDMETWMLHEAASVQASLELGDARHACESRNNLGFALLQVGAYAEAAQVLEAGRAEAQQLGLANPAATATQNLAMAHFALGDFERARALLVESAKQMELLGNQRLAVGTQVYLARVDLARGELELAEVEVTGAIEGHRRRPALLAAALATRAQIRLALGAQDSARRDAHEAAKILAELGEVEEDEALIRLMDAETAEACGDQAGTDAALTEAIARLDARAARISSTERRAQFEAITEHRRTRALGRARRLR